MTEPASSQLSLAARLLQAQDDERRRISRDLHDSVGQSLAVLKMELSQGASTGDPTAAAKFRECMRLVDEAVREVRAVSYLLHPPLLDLSGLCSAIREYAVGFDKRSDMTIHVEIPERVPRLSVQQETGLFRVLQECLINVHRHSRAKNAWIRAKPGRREFRLEVEDDGQGIANFDMAHTPETRASLGVGIAGMRERLRELGGRLDIKSGPQGTTITASLPYHETSTEEPEQGPKASPLEPKRAEHNGNRRLATIPGRILVVDDHELMRRGVRALIENEPDLEVCGEAQNVAEAVQLARQLKPDAMILDLHMPSGSGWEVINSMRRSEFRTRILIFSAHNSYVTKQTAKAAGCQGFVPKSQASSMLVRALHAVVNGHTFYAGE